MWSLNKLISSTYKILRFAAANMPGSRAFTPSLMASSISSDPTTLSSVALNGISTTDCFFFSIIKSPSFFL